MLGMWAGQFNSPTKVEQESKSKVAVILEKAGKRSNGILLVDALNMLLADGFTFEQVRLLTLKEFQTNINSLIDEHK